MPDKPADASPQNATLAPWLAVSDAAQAVDFYERAFGAVVGERLELETGQLVVAQLQVGRAAFWVQDDPASSPAANGGTSPVRMILSVDDPDALLARALAAGAVEITAMHDEHGWRVGRLADPSGYHWEIANRTTESR